MPIDIDIAYHINSLYNSTNIPVNWGEILSTWYTRFRDKVRTRAQEEDGLAYAIRTAYSLLGHAYTQAVITIILPIGISYLMSKITSKNPVYLISNAPDELFDTPVPLSYAPAGTRSFLPLFITLILVYLGLQALILMANRHQHAKLNDIKWFQSALKSHAKINETVASQIYIFTNRFVRMRNEKKKLPFDLTRDLVGFHIFAFEVCGDIFSMLKDLYKCDKPQVTVYQRFTENEEEYIRMIAYATYNNAAPSSFSEKYSLSGSSNRYDVRIFNGKEKKIHVLPNKAAVQKEFEISDHSREREEAICQYIGIPVKNKKGEITFLLQIDVNEVKKSEKELLELGDNVFLPFAQLLLATYEHERMLETLHSSIVVDIPSTGKPDRSDGARSRRNETNRLNQ